MNLSARLYRVAVGAVRNAWREKYEPTPREWATVAEAMGLPPNRNTKRTAKMFGDDPEGLWSHYGFPDALHKWIGGSTPLTFEGGEAPSAEEVRRHPSYAWFSAELGGKTYDYGMHGSNGEVTDRKMKMREEYIRALRTNEPRFRTQER